jgi:hypothetical protein
VTAQGLALPGMQNGARGYGYDVGVKTEPDDLLRMRGGAVRWMPPAACVMCRSAPC